RELRQLEGAYLSNAALERSKQRLQLLPYVQSVEYETVPVPGKADEVDVEFEIEEGLPGQFGGSLGYSESQGIILGGNFIHSNFLGTGNRVALNLSGGEYYKLYEFSLTDYYRTVDELSRPILFSYSDITRFTTYTSQFSTETLSTGVRWQYPITEYPYFNFGFQGQASKRLTRGYSAQQAREWVRQNGDPFTVPGASDLLGTKVKPFELSAGWQYRNLNASIFPTLGSRIRANLSATAPGSEVEYYYASLDFL